MLSISRLNSVDDRMINVRGEAGGISVERGTEELRKLPPNCPLQIS
jgi:hypothetical protein